MSETENYNLIPEVNTEVFIQSYKHNGSLHRTWCKAHVLEANEDRFVTVTNKAWVIESDGRKWLTREPAVCYFWTHRWYNVIAMLRKTGIYYYCNLASPSLYDGEAIKNIDYDLDVKVFPDDSYMVLDENEFEYHRQQMNYPEDIVKLCIESKDELIKMIESHEKPFNFSYTNEYIMRYFELIFDKNT